MDMDIFLLIFMFPFVLFLAIVLWVIYSVKNIPNEISSEKSNGNNNSTTSTKKTVVGHVEIPNSHQEYYDSKREKESIIYNPKRVGARRKTILFFIFLVFAIIFFASTDLLYSKWFVFFITFYITLLILSNANQNKELSLNVNERKDYVTINYDKYKESRIVYIDSIKESFGMYYINCVDIDGCTFTSKAIAFNPKYVLDRIGIDCLTVWVNPRNHHDYVVDTNIIYRNRM